MHDPDDTPRRYRHTLAQLRTFCAAVSTGRMARAAAVRRTSQPSVSRQIAELEAVLGARLVERGRDGLVLTGAGRRVQALAARIIEDVDRLAERFGDARHAGGPGHTVRIGATEGCAAHVLPRHLARTGAGHPQVHARVKVLDRAQAIGALEAGEVDVAACAVDGPVRGCDLHPMGASPFVGVVAPDHPLAGAGPIAARDVAEHPLVGHRRGHPAREAWSGWLRWAHGVEPEVAVEIDGWRAIVNLVAAGAGVALVPEVCAGARVERLRLEDGPPARRWAALTRHGRSLAPGARAFVEAVADARQAA